jgi:hypothetical protein
MAFSRHSDYTIGKIVTLGNKLFEHVACEEEHLRRVESSTGTSQ